jgi:hypothetical protein
MAYETSTATDATDLMNKLRIFATANGYTQDYYNGSTRFLSLSRSADNLYVSFYWDNTNNIAIYQALGYSAGSAETPWTQVNDSGNGYSTLAEIYRGRNVNNIGAGPFTKYHFFGYTDPYAIHVVLEFSPGLYRHFCFGMIKKNGTWTGGAFAAGHQWNAQSSGSQLDAPKSIYHTVLLDNVFSPTNVTFNYTLDAGGTLHIEGMPSQAAASKWGHCTEPGSGYIYNDRGGNPRVRIMGGARGGPAVVQYGWMLPDLANGFIPIIPLQQFYHLGDEDLGNNGWFYLGYMNNIGHVHLQGINVGQEVTVGSDTWICFPAVRKSSVGSNNQESWNMGIIYKKVT